MYVYPVVVMKIQFHVSRQIVDSCHVFGFFSNFRIALWLIVLALLTHRSAQYVGSTQNFLKKTRRSDVRKQVRDSNMFVYTRLRLLENISRGLGSQAFCLSSVRTTAWRVGCAHAAEKRTVMKQFVKSKVCTVKRAQRRRRHICIYVLRY